MKNTSLFILIALIFSFFPAAQAEPRRPADWISHLANGVEIVEIPSVSNGSSRPVVLMIPKFFQNANSFDVSPERDISIARFLMKTFDLKIYLLNARGLGRADDGNHLNLDDLAIEDIPNAIRWVSYREKRKIFVLGHSQGGIMLQASLSGITRLENGDAGFTLEASNDLQTFVRGAAISGSNVAMTVDDEKNPLIGLAKTGRHLMPILKLLPSRFNIADLVRFPLLRFAAHLPLWEMLYHRENVDHDAQTALFRLTLENSWKGVLFQYIDGISRGGIRTAKGDHREDYASALGNISVPVAYVIYGLDPFAQAKTSERDDFSKIGSAQKHFFLVPGQGHEDFMLNAAMHSDWTDPFRFLLN